MALVVVDTNVAVVAKGRGTEPAERKLAAVRTLLGITANERLVLDATGLIFREYAGYFDYSGQPGTGDMFFRWVHDNRWSGERVLAVHITPSADDPQDFAEFPRDAALAGFDRDDRKFVAAARAAPEETRIVEATDTDWWEFQAALNKAGVMVDFICRDYIKEVFESRAPSAPR